MKSRFKWFFVFICSLLISCQDRIFDNPLDPNLEERGYEIVSIIPISGIIPIDLTFSGESIWVTDALSRILSINYNSGSVIRELSVGRRVDGMCYTGVDFWFHVSDSLQLIQANIINGETLKILNLSEGSYGPLDFADNTIYLVDRLSNAIKLVDADTGQILDSLTSPSFSMDGVCFDGENIWLLDASAVKIHRLDAAGDLVDSYDAPDKNPSGLAYSQGVIWLGDRSGKIYKLRFQ